MEPINQIVQRVSENEQPKRVENLNDKTLINLWERLNHIYGHKFSSAFGESAFDGKGVTETARTWASGLRGVSGDEIAAGLRECVDSGESWPPALPEFVAMCKGRKENGFGLSYIPECHRQENRVRPENRLSSDERDAHRKEIGSKGVSIMKSVLRVRK